MRRTITIGLTILVAVLAIIRIGVTFLVSAPPGSITDPVLKTDMEEIKTHPDRFQAHLYFAADLFERGKVKEAEEQSAEALRLQPNNPASLLVHAKCLKISGQTVRAQSELELALRHSNKRLESDEIRSELGSIKKSL